jgi:hypothetical protein
MTKKEIEKKINELEIQKQITDDKREKSHIGIAILNLKEKLNEFNLN